MPLRPFLFFFRPPAPRAFCECTRVVLEMPLCFASPLRREKKAHEQRARARSVKKREREKIDDDGLRLSRTKRHLSFFSPRPSNTPVSLSFFSLFPPPLKTFQQPRSTRPTPTARGRTPGATTATGRRQLFRDGPGQTRPRAPLRSKSLPSKRQTQRPPLSPLPRSGAPPRRRSTTTTGTRGI